jgi:hypothetical protein
MCTSRWDWRLQKAPFADGPDTRGSQIIIIDLLPNCILSGVLRLEMDIDVSNGTHVTDNKLLILTVK